MAIDRTAFTALVDDSGSGLDGSVVNKALIATVLLDPIDAALAGGLAASAAAAAAADAVVVAALVASRGSPRCVAYHNTTQNIPHATVTVLSLNSEDVDVGGPLHDPTTNNSRVTVPAGQGGFYVAVGTVIFGSVPSGTVLLARLTWNGIADIAQVVPVAALTGNITAVQVIWSGALVATNYLELKAYQQQSPPAALDLGHASLRLAQNTLTLMRVA